MSHSEHKELIQAEKLIKEGKIEKALQTVNDLGKKKDLSYHGRISYYTLKSNLAFYFLDGNELTKYAEKAYRESQKLKNSLLLLDVYIQMANSLILHSKTIEVSEFIKRSEELINTLPRELTTDITKRKAYILWLKSYEYRERGDLDKAIEYAEQALVLFEDLNLRADIALGLFRLGVLSWLNGDLNSALEYSESCKMHAKNLNLKRLTHRCYVQFGIIYQMKGELDLALSYNEKVLAFAEKENDLGLRSTIYNNIGILYQEKGDYNRALKNMEKSITIAEEIGINIRKFTVSDSIFHLALDMNDLERAEQCLNRMEQIADQEKNQTNRYNIWYNIDRAIFLKKSPRALNRGKAEEILKQLIQEGISDFESLKIALLHLCDLLLFELSATSEAEILDELQVYITQLFDTVKSSRSYSLLAEIYLLEARLSLITLDLIRARKFLTKAQEIAEKYGLNRLAIKISNEHDELLKELDTWDKLKESNASVSERLELARPNEQMETIIRKREIVVPKPSDEEPVLILIITEGGRPLFSQTFVKDKSFEDHLFGGFFTAINSFVNEKFSEGLDRAIFGKHTLLMNSVSPFLLCYVFKGQSYSAQHRINYFISKLQKDKDVWETFEKFYQTNMEVQLKDVPSLEPLINEIFINRKILVP
ncbi:MAG: tetratricopeptide repeat protein [Candidatus Hodarchaeota archaeon]